MNARLTLPPVGFGTAPLGNLYRAIDDDTATATVAAALAGGLRYADTAPYYGFGLSEARLGHALGGEDDVVVSTKVGRVLEPLASVAERERHGFVDGLPFAPVYDYSREGILRSHEASLKRLGRDRFDILYVHDIGRRSILIVRTEEGLKAYHNSCLHRGTKLKPSGSTGWSEQIQCPFHGWTWHLDGTMKRLPCEWDFPHVDKARMTLPEVLVDSWNGFVFINMDRMVGKDFETGLANLKAIAEK